MNSRLPHRFQSSSNDQNQPTDGVYPIQNRLVSIAEHPFCWSRDKVKWHVLLLSPLDLWVAGQTAALQTNDDGDGDDALCMDRRLVWLETPPPQPAAVELDPCGCAASTQLTLTLSFSSGSNSLAVARYFEMKDNKNNDQNKVLSDRTCDFEFVFWSLNTCYFESRLIFLRWYLKKRFEREKTS